MKVGDVTPSPCNRCGRETEHDVLVSELVAEEDYPDADSWTMESVLRCCGCKEIAIRRQGWWRDRIPDPEESCPRKNGLPEYMPRRTWRNPPDWLAQIEGTCPDLHAMLVEIYTTTNDDQVRMLAMGVRAAVDLLMTQRIGDIGGFDIKLKKMVENGHLSKAQAETLDVVIDAGSAAAHRGFSPTRELLVEMVATMETMVRELYISGPMMRALKVRIPPRPPRIVSQAL